MKDKIERSGETIEDSFLRKCNIISRQYVLYLYCEHSIRKDKGIMLTATELISLPRKEIKGKMEERSSY